MLEPSRGAGGRRVRRCREHRPVQTLRTRTAMPSQSSPQPAQYATPSPPVAKRKSILDTLVVSPIAAVGSAIGVGASDSMSLITTGKTLTAKKYEAAIRIQALCRGWRARRQFEQARAVLVVDDGYMCFGPRKSKAKTDEEQFGFLCGMCFTPRKPSKSGRPIVPRNGLPGVARAPSFSKEQMQAMERKEAESRFRR